MAGETLFSFTIGMLRGLLVEEECYLNALRSPVQVLREKLTQMENLMDYEETRRDMRISEVIDLANDLINSIENYVLQVSSKKYLGLIERALRPKVLLAIQKITAKITDLVKSLSTKSVKEIGGNNDYYRVQDLSYFNAADFVGRKDAIENLVHFLIDEENDEIPIVSVLGMGGLGKTTLARRVYKDIRVVSHFQGFAFVCVSQICDAGAILRHILQQLAPEKDEEINSMSKREVIDQLEIVHREKRCLVVVDDIWSRDDWERLRHGLPNGDTASKVLLTTRIQDVAEVGLCYVLDSLSEEEGWELLQKKTSRRQEYTDQRVNQRMEELGREMIGWCRGIPLADLALRGILVTKGTLGEWERFYARRTRETEYEQLNRGVRYVLSLSYIELPYQLKPCFLYLGNFLENEEIEAEKLYMLWEAEGMLLLRDRKEGETMMDVAERYMSELVGRSMVEASLAEEADPKTKKRFKACRLHDLIRELCLSIVKKENFLLVHDYRNILSENFWPEYSSYLQNYTKTPRHALYIEPGSLFSVNINHEAKKNVCSLRLVKGYLKKFSDLNKFRSLRVLDFDCLGLPEEKLKKDIIHLKYLGFNACRVARGKFPLSVGNFQFLPTLDLRIISAIDDPIPDDLLRKLKRLRHLLLPIHYAVTPEFSRLRLEDLRELETLINFDSEKCEMKDVLEVTNLRRFEGSISISSEDGEHEDWNWKELICYMKKVHLASSRHSSLRISLNCQEIEKFSNELIEILPGCEGMLHNLSIAELDGKLPQIFSFTPLLIKLTLRRCDFEEDPIPTLEKLSYLQQLTLLNVELKGKEMTCSSRGFPCLRHLEIIGMKNLEKWRVEDGSMPNLSSLEIRRCSKLLALPQELQFISGLKNIRIGHIPEEFMKTGGWVKEKRGKTSRST